jgi:CO/xanthine dehydrogenase FAD-binding subunit
VTVTVAGSLDEVFEALESQPQAEILAGGTDFMVEVNFGHRRPRSVVAVSRVPELRGWQEEGEALVLGAGLTYTEMMLPALAERLPALAQAARTVGSPQIRNAGTLGGNIATASPAGDTLPVLAALDAEVVLRRRGGERRLPVEELLVGPKRTALLPGEVVTEARVPARLACPFPAVSQEFLKVGTRNAMVIAVANLALVVDWAGRRVRCALGSVGPVPIRAREAEARAESSMDWEARRLPAAEREAFGQLAGEAARPIDDHRSTASYRRRAVAVCARRALERVLAGPAWTA